MTCNWSAASEPEGFLGCEQRLEGLRDRSRANDLAKEIFRTEWGKCYSGQFVKKKTASSRPLITAEVLTGLLVRNRATACLLKPTELKGDLYLYFG